MSKATVYTIQRTVSHGIPGAGWTEFWTGRGWSEEYPDAEKYPGNWEAQAETKSSAFLRQSTPGQFSIEREGE